MKARLPVIIFSSIFALIASPAFSADAQQMAKNYSTSANPQATPEKANQTPESAKVSKADDTKITNSVKTKLRGEKLLNGSQINVTTNGGVVTLTGDLKNEQEVSKAVELANSVEGVRDVDTSKLNAEASTQPFADTIITAKVKGAFIREKLFGDKPIEVTSITVETTNGVVYLTGTAESRDIIQNAEKLAKEVSGVKKVDNKVQVKAESEKSTSDADKSKTDTKENNANHTDKAKTNGVNNKKK